MTISDINSEIRDLCDADTVSYPASTLLRRVNNEYEKIIGKIIGADGTWQFDDSNYTDLPIGLGTLVDSQQQYSFDSQMLSIERVEVLDVNGIWRKLIPLNENLVEGSLAEFQKTAGLPIYYSKEGSSVFLYPKPSSANVTLTSGIKIFFQRTADLFTSDEVTTGTKVAGFATPYHMMLCYGASIPYCMKYKKDRVALYQQKYLELEQDMMSFYSRRTKDEIPRLETKRESNK